MNRSAQRLIPVVFRLAGVVLLISLVAGQVWQRQPGSSATRKMLALVARYCPAASLPVAKPSVADGAHAFDRWSLRRLADLLDGDGVSRCAVPGRSRGEGKGGRSPEGE